MRIVFIFWILQALPSAMQNIVHNELMVELKKLSTKESNRLATNPHRLLIGRATADPLLSPVAIFLPAEILQIIFRHMRNIKVRMRFVVFQQYNSYDDHFNWIANGRIFV